MLKKFILAITCLIAAGIVSAVELVKDGKPAASIILAADIAAKTAIVNLIELRVARGMCGKSYMLLTGEVAAVESAIEYAKSKVVDAIKHELNK